MATLGSTSEPTTGQVWYGLNSTNHHTIALTMPAGGPWLITDVGVWAAGQGMSAAYKLGLWDSGGTLRAQTAGGTVASQAFAIGNNTKLEQALITPYQVAGGAVVHVGIGRAASDSLQFGVRSGTRKQWASSTYITSFGAWSSVTDAIGAWLTYESANVAPAAPVSLSPTGSATVNSGTAPVLSGTRSDPDGDNMTYVQIVVYADDAVTVKYDSGKVSDTGTTFARTVSLPAAHLFYRWKARTWDSQGLVGPYSAQQRFYANAVPATPAAPTVETDTLTPVISGSFSDSGDTLAAVQIEVTLNASPYTSKWASGDLAKSGTAWTATYAGSVLSWAVAYRARYRVKDSHGAYSAWSAWKTFTPVQPVGPNNMTPRTTNPRLNDLTPDLTVGHTTETFRNEEIMVRSVGSDSGGTTLWSKVWDGADYAAVNTKLRTYAGTALTWGQRIFWKSRIELNSDGTITAWSPYFELRMNADPTSPTGMTPTGGVITEDATPALHADFADPDLDQGDTATFVEIELADNVLGTNRWVPASVAPTTGLYHDVSVSPTGMLGQAGVTGANATDIITLVDHGFGNGQKVRFSAITGGTGLTTGVDYFVRDISGNTFKLAASLGGTAINFTTDITAGTIVPQELGVEKTYKWRARFTDFMGRVGAWSSYQVFKVSLAPTASPVDDAPVTLAVSAAADDIIDTAAAHGYVVGNLVRFVTLTGGAGLTVATNYYVIAANLAATTFQVALTPGGTAVNFTTDVTAGTVARRVGPSTPVTESTPTLDWTYASGAAKTQYSYRVRVYDKGPTGANFADEVLVYDSGEIVSALTAHDVPFGVLVNTRDYRWEVTVKDTDQLAFTLT